MSTPHRHHFTPTLRLTLTLPETATGRYELFQVFACDCGTTFHCTSWARNTGRHLTWEELQEVGRQERVFGMGQAPPGRAVDAEKRRKRR